MHQLIRFAAVLTGLMLLYLTGVGTRRAIVEAQQDRLGADMSFTLETALQMRRVKMIHDTGSLPHVDPMIQYPEGVENAKTYTLGSEFLYAALARALPAHVPFADRLRWIECLWFCLSIPLMACWLRIWRGSWAAGTWAALFYAVSLSAVLRSTGLELSRENFAIPWLIASFLAEALAYRAWGRAAQRLWAVASALLLAAALASWDLVQVVVLFRMIWWGVHEARGRSSPLMRLLGCSQVAALLVLAVAHPYFRAHGWWHAPAMLAGYAAAAAGWARPDAARRWLRPAWVFGLVLGVGVLAGMIGTYGQQYSHFSSLLWAKVRHLNVKPSDPSLLTFEQRILWTPALHSATRAIAAMLFPAILYLTPPALLLVYGTSRKDVDPRAREWVWITVAALAAFPLFVRFHVYLALACAVLFGLLASVPGRVWLRRLLWLALVTVLLVEAWHTVRRPAQWGRVDVYYKELDELANWLKGEVAPDPVLAGFGVSAYIAAYGKCAVLLHPKFEDVVIRERVKAYGEQLFKGTEESFRAWADGLGARYYVHGLGEFASRDPERQMRYMVDALNPPPDVPARRFEAQADDFTWFRKVWGNRKYVVYRMVTGDEAFRANHQLQRAEKALSAGALDEPEAAAVAALQLHPRLVRAAEILAAADRLREAGFRAGAGATP